MNAADALAEATEDYAIREPALLMTNARRVAALLAHGEQGQGVTIEADGDLHPKDPPMTTRLTDGTLWALKRAVLRANLARLETDGYVLVPISAEAGDQGTWMGGGLEITYPSAEAGDTDG